MSYASTAVVRIARLNADGTLDRSFAGAVPNSGVRAVVLQPDGKIIIGGDFTCIGGINPTDNATCVATGGAIRQHIARLNSDGTLDTGYAPNVSGFDNTVYTLALQADGKVIVGGAFTLGFGTSVAVHGIARLDTDGRVDPAFVQTGVGLDGPVYTTAIQPDGKVLIAGNFTHLEGSAMPYVARLNANGAMDTTFGPTGTGLNGLVQSLALQPDGNIIVGGFFTSYNGVARSHLARLTSSAGLDTTLAPGAGLAGPGAATYVALQPNGKIVVAGDFTTYNGTARTGLLQVLNDGSLDSSFVVGTGLNALAQVVIVAEGSILVGGNFTTYNGTTRGKLARIYGTASLTLIKAGAGTGAVNSTTTGIACGATCTAVFDQASSVTLAATAAAGSTFTGWGGACSGTSATCVVTMSAAVAVTATFVPDGAFTVTKAKAKISARRIVVTSTITVRGAGTIKQTATTKKGNKLTTRCSTTKIASKAATYTLTCTIGKTGRAVLRKARLALTIRTTFTPINGSLTAKTGTLTLKRLR